MAHSAATERSSLPSADYEADDVLVVREPEQLKALGDDLRSKIVILLRDRASPTTSAPRTATRARSTASQQPSTGEGSMRRLRRPSGGLWNNTDFVKLWSGQSISEFGSQISGLAIPLLAATQLHASPFAFSLLGVLGFLPFILFALPAGVWVDRLPRRPILIVGDAGRAVLLLLIPVLWAT